MKNDVSRSTPAEIRNKGGMLVGVTWGDQHRSEYPARYLRGRCPCALCVDEISGHRRVAEDDVSPDVRLNGLSLVGNYAVRGEWSDGHATGIYSFDLLRDICPCPDCVNRDPART